MRPIWQDLSVAEFLDMDPDPSLLVWMVPLAVALWLIPMALFAFQVAMALHERKARHA